MTRTAILNITSRCNQRCVFCLEAAERAGAPREPSAREVIGQLELLWARGARQITFMGGETLLRADLPEILDAACALGYRRIGAATNGTTVGREGNLRKLREHGLAFLELSLHGHTRELANAIARTSFTFDRQAAALRELDRAGDLPTIVNVVVCRENREHLGAIVDYVHGGFPRIPARFKFKFVSLMGGEAARVRETGRALAYADVDAVALGDRVRGNGVSYWFYNFPLCRLGEHAAMAQEVATDAAGERYFDLDPAIRGYIDSGRQLCHKIWPARPCAACSVSVICPGVDASYAVAHPGLEGLEARADDAVPILAAALRDLGADPGLAAERVEGLLRANRSVPG